MADTVCELRYLDDRRSKSEHSNIFDLTILNDILDNRAEGEMK
jgi:hypothetical protein